MIVEISSDIVRLLVIDISGVYSKIYDETFVPKNKENDVRNKYIDGSKYKVIRTL